MQIYQYAKDPYEAKDQYLINKREIVGLNHFNDPKTSMQYSVVCWMSTKILTITMQIKKEKYE